MSKIVVNIDTPLNCERNDKDNKRLKDSIEDAFKCKTVDIKTPLKKRKSRKKRRIF